MNTFKGIITEYADDGTVDVTFVGDEFKHESMTFTRTDALRIAASMVRCVIKATVWKMKTKKRA